MRLPSLLIGFGSFPNVQSVPSNNYIPKEICIIFVTDFEDLSACHRRDSYILLHIKDASDEAKCQQDIMSERVMCNESQEKYDCITKIIFT